MNPVDALQAAGLNPIVIDENFDFSQLNSLVQRRPTYEELQSCIGVLCDLLDTSTDLTSLSASVWARQMVSR